MNSGFGTRTRFAELLVDWFDADRRPFPWRDSRDPYYVTVCEVLLQRTNAEKVVIAANELFAKFPSAAELGRAERKEIARILRPTGLHKRVGYILEIAAAFAMANAKHQQVGVSDIARMPGVGPYVVSAVRLLAFGEADALIDEHTLRILRRVFEVHAPARRHPTRAVTDFARSLVPIGFARQYNLGVLDLGRLVCRPKNPKCGECPIESVCKYAAAQRRFGGLD